MALKGLSDIQNERFARLELQLKKSVRDGDIRAAKNITADIQEILRKSGYSTRLMQIKNWLYEAAVEAGDYEFAIDGLKAVKNIAAKNTRINLEATALLAIAYLRKNDYKNAEPVIAEVLKNDKVIKSDFKRAQFRKEIIERFENEVILSSLKNTGRETLNIDDIQTMAVSQSQQSSEKEMYNYIGSSIPQNVISSLYRIDSFSKNQLPTAERLKLPSPEQTISHNEVGKNFFSSIKRILYKSLCDPASDIYKVWFNEGMKIVLNKKYIASAVLSMFINLGIGIKALAVSVIALIIKFGIEVYCDRYRPTGIMEMR